MATKPKTFNEATDIVQEIRNHAKNGEYAGRRVRKLMEPFLPPEFVQQWVDVTVKRAAENIAYAAEVKANMKDAKIHPERWHRG